MPPFLVRLREYHRGLLKADLHAAGLSSDEVDAALFAVDYAEAATMLPYGDIAQPYQRLRLVGWTPAYRPLLRLLELSVALNLTFAELVERLLQGRGYGEAAPVEAQRLLTA